MNKKKSIVLVLSVALGINTLPSVAETYIAKDNNISVSEIQNKCLPFNLTKLQDAIKDKKQICINNPFEESAKIPISFVKKDEPLLELADFDNVKGIYDLYLNFTNLKAKNHTDEVMVSEFLLSNKKIYKFFKFTADSKVIQQFESAFKKTEFKGSGEMFLFFHELMHLSPRHSHDNNEFEATADLASTIMISLKNNYDLDKFLSLVDTVENIRKKPFNKYVNPVAHYNKQSFKNINENINSDAFLEEFNYLKSKDLTKPEDFAEVLKIVENLAFQAQTNNDKELFAMAVSKSKTKLT